MFARIRDVPTAPLRRHITQTIRHASAATPKRKGLSGNDTQPSNALAERLAATDLWVPVKKGRRRADLAQLGDRHRVNIVSEELCGTYYKEILAWTKR